MTTATDMPHKDHGQCGETEEARPDDTGQRWMMTYGRNMGTTPSGCRSIKENDDDRTMPQKKKKRHGRIETTIGRKEMRPIDGDNRGCQTGKTTMKRTERCDGDNDNKGDNWTCWTATDRIKTDGNQQRQSPGRRHRQRQTEWAKQMNTMAGSDKQSKSGWNNDDDGRIGAATGKEPAAVGVA